MAQLPNLGVSNMVRSATGTVSAVLEATDLFSAYINKVKQDQEIDHKLHRAEYAEKAIANAAIRSAERGVTLQEFAKKSSDHETLLNEALEKFNNLIHGELPKSEEVIESE